VNDHLLVLEGRIEVWDDSDLPARRVRGTVGRRNRERFRRSAILAPLAERALV